MYHYSITIIIHARFTIQEKSVNAVIIRFRVNITRAAPPREQLHRGPCESIRCLRFFFYNKCITRKCLTLKMKFKVMRFNIRNGAIR